MSARTVRQYDMIDVLAYNASGALIVAAEPVQADPTPSGAIGTTIQMTIDPFASSRGPFEGLTPVPAIGFSIMQGDATAAAGDLPIRGVTLSDIANNAWGLIRTWGPCLCKTTETTDDAHLTAYGISTTAGQLSEVAPGAGVYTVAFQWAASGVTAAASKRRVFVVAARVDFIANVQAPGGYGTFV